MVMIVILLLIGLVFLIWYFRSLELSYKLCLRQRILIQTFLDGNKFYISQYKLHFYSKWKTYPTQNLDRFSICTIDSALQFCEEERERYNRRTVYKTEKHYI